MNINLEEIILQQSTIVKHENDSEDRFMLDIKTERDSDGDEYQDNTLYLTSIKEESVYGNGNDNKKVKEESSLYIEDEGSIVEIKTEELMLKNEDEDYETGADEEEDIQHDVVTNSNTNYVAKNYHNSSKHYDSTKRFNCDKCDYKTNCKSSFISHFLLKHDNNSFKKYYETNRTSELKIHNSSKHNDSKRRHSCHDCDYKSDLRRYLFLNHDKKTLICNHCNYKTNIKSSLTKHLSKHVKSTSETYSCGQCDYKTTIESYLTTHFLLKHDESTNKTYSCDQCDYKAKIKRYLRRHIHSKHDKKKHSCDHCDYKTNLRSKLKEHFLSKHDKNTTETYNCNQCDYKTKIKRYLRMHIYSKHDNKKHNCEHCDYKTNHRGRLKEHFLSQHDKNATETYNCNQCDYKTKIKSYLTKHFLSKHANK